MSGSPKGIMGLAHELIHVSQFASFGMGGFLLAYGQDAIGMERVAYQIEPAVFGFLTQAYTGFSTQVCPEGGACINYPIEWVSNQIDSRILFVGQTPDGNAEAVVGNPYDKFWGGAICIEGICYAPH